MFTNQELASYLKKTQLILLGFPPFLFLHSHPPVLCNHGDLSFFDHIKAVTKEHSYGQRFCFGGTSGKAYPCRQG